MHVQNSLDVDGEAVPAYVFVLRGRPRQAEVPSDLTPLTAADLDGKVCEIEGERFRISNASGPVRPGEHIMMDLSPISGKKGKSDDERGSGARARKGRARTRN